MFLIDTPLTIGRSETKILQFNAFALNNEECMCHDLQFMNNGSVLMFMPFRFLVKFFSPIQFMKICLKELK